MADGEEIQVAPVLRPLQRRRLFSAKKLRITSDATLYSQQRHQLDRVIVYSTDTVNDDEQPPPFKRLRPALNGVLEFDAEAFPCRSIDTDAAPVETVVTFLSCQQTYSGLCIDDTSIIRRGSTAATVLYAAASLLDDEAIEIQAEVAIQDFSPLADWLIVSSGCIKVVVVQAKTADVDSAKRKLYQLMDAAFVEKNERRVNVYAPLFGIVTNGLDWYLYRADANGVRYSLMQVNEAQNARSSVARLIGTVCDMIETFGF